MSSDAPNAEDGETAPVKPAGRWKVALVLVATIAAIAVWSVALPVIGLLYLAGVLT